MTDMAPQPTKLRLAATLREAGFDDLAEEAARGLYDDYESPNAMPLHNLVARLKERMDPKAEALIARVIDGDFDGTEEESEAWARSAEGQGLFRDLLGG
jgi:hypothetical protein